MVSITRQLPGPMTDHRVVLSGISWERYEQLADDLERAGRRLMLTYDNGELEVEMPSEIHELIKRFISDLLTAYFLDRNIRFLPLGQTTFKRRLLGKGVEPDDCYYLTNLGRISQAGDNDLERVPPPDLAIEVEVTVPLLDKLPVYAAIGIRELWHINETGEARILLLEGGAYIEAPASAEVPYFTAAMLSDWVRRRLNGEHFVVLQEFRATLER
jgi:Uma2 family endonuclease